MTGAAGFIGSHLCERLLGRGCQVTGIDSFDPFYDPAVKRANLSEALLDPRFRLVEADICDAAAVEVELDAWRPVDVVVHLAARAGVRPSIEEPLRYVRTNVEGTTALLELSRRRGIGRFVFASSSSVYGNAARVPFSEDDPVAQPISPYAATKRAGELLCHTYHHLFGINAICLRLFTVYGPRQRPDLAIHKFTRLIGAGRRVPLFGDGTTARDYTYVDDIVDGIVGAMETVSQPEPVFEIVNLGGNRTTTLRDLVSLLGEILEVEPQIEWLPAQPGDVERTYADVGRARRLFGYESRTPLEVGLRRFVSWVRDGEQTRAGIAAEVLQPVRNG
ncbi:MAG TPA: NAD-dependent epimerase/dehydratase family protein [Longimicrobiaceae bacterium]|nr:NAD-dependent epimerase/dehydratase family protein [Longimicrobiaceae bacterium]